MFDPLTKKLGGFLFGNFFCCIFVITITNIMKTIMTRTEIRKEERTFKQEGVNQQYSYTTPESIAWYKEERGNLDWLPSKEGQSIDQHWIKRITQQINSSNIKRAVRLGCFGVFNNDDIKLDDKVRQFICNKDYHQEVDFEDDGAGKEWVLTYVGDIYHDMDFYPLSVSDILNNEEFMIRWYQRLQNSKQLYFDKHEYYNKVYEPKAWQKTTVETMLGSGKVYHQLGLAPRFGKTLTVLEYFKKKVLKGEYTKDELWLVALSKSLSSNTSFINDYNDFGFFKYFNMVEDISLFVDEDKVIEKLKSQLPEGSKVVMVTDEADFASHTKISTERLSLVNNTFNVVEYIVMTGTGYGKASKIFKGVPLCDINSIYFTYTEMCEIGGDVVKRNIVNVQYDITEDFGEGVLNIRQSINDPAKHKDLAKFVQQWTLCEDTQERVGLQETEIVMIFVKPDNKANLKKFVNKFEKMYGNDAVCMVLTGDDSSNREAEKDVKKELSTMRKNKDNRKLVVFSMGMGSRSFSVSKIYRVIELIDGDLTSATIQEFSRCLTFEEGKEVADIIRIGFTEMGLAEQLYLMENEIPDYGTKSNNKVKRFLSNNSFSKVAILKTGELRKEDLYQEKEDLGMFLDSVCRFVDNTNYITTRLIDENMKVDAGIDKFKTTVTKVIDDSVPKSKSIKPNKGTKVLNKLNEKELRNYVKVTRCIPSYMFLFKYDNVKEFCDSEDWGKVMLISNRLFTDNYNSSDEFKGVVDALVRQYQSKTEEQHQNKVLEYLEMIGL
jgi:hypothetical protein